MKKEYNIMIQQLEAVRKMVNTKEKQLNKEREEFAATKKDWEEKRKGKEDSLNEERAKFVNVPNVEGWKENC